MWQWDNMLYFQHRGASFKQTNKRHEAFCSAADTNKSPDIDLLVPCTRGTDLSTAGQNCSPYAQDDMMCMSVCSVLCREGHVTGGAGGTLVPGL